MIGLTLRRSAISAASLALQLSSSENTDPAVVCTRAGIGTRINKYGVIEIATTGPELVPNSAFDGVPDNTPATNLPGWTIAYGVPAVAAVIGNQMTITANAANQGARLDFATVSGRIYRLKLDIKLEATSTDIYVVSGASTGFSAPAGNNRVFTFTAGASTTTIYFRPNNNAGSSTCKLTNISVQQASDAPRINYDVTKIAGYGANLVINGTFDADINGWSHVGVGAESWNAGKMRRDSQGGSGGSYVDIPVTVGKRYRVAGTATLVSGAGAVGIWAYDGASFVT
jgi:hypothetical protein